MILSLKNLKTVQTLLAEKEAEVLAAIDVAEKKLDIEINKENPTQVGPVKLIKDNKPKEDKA